MRQITYHQRVKNVLQRIAQNDVQYISFDDFLDRVGDSQLLDTGRKGSRLKQYVSKSIARECRAGRIRVEGLCNSNRKLVFTAQGMRYFQRYALHTLHDENSREFQRLTVRKLRNDTKALNDRLHEIREILTNGQADQTRTIVYFEDIPSAVSKLIQRIRAVGEQNTELSALLAQNHAVERALKRSYPLPPAPAGGSGSNR